MKIVSSQWLVASKSVFCLALSIMLFAHSFLAQAQQPAKIPRIGYLTNESLSALSARTEAFRKGLRELGYLEGKNIVIEWRDAEGKLDRLNELAVELVRLRVDVIVTPGRGATRSAKEATMTIPIVMTQERDPVTSGFIASLARPGGNITGLSRLAPELNGKQLELLKEIIPRLFRVAVLGSFTYQSSRTRTQTLKEIEVAAGAFGVKLQYLDVQSLKDIEAAFRAARKGQADAVLWLVSGPSAVLTDPALENSRFRAGYRRYTNRQNMWKPAGLCPTA
jgi:putative tryptophan/tyrosine transport system substrate-binding protein